MLELEILSQKIASCTKCPELVANRTKTVPGDGNPNARLMILGECPGQEEDLQGKPFVGRSGKLLSNILKACDINREDVYICNILKCRPPGNRTPTFVECKNCREYLEEQISIINPEYLLLLGSTASNAILGLPIGQARGRWHSYRDKKVLCSFHPSFLLRQPEKKKDNWEDMQMLLQELNESATITL